MPEFLGIKYQYHFDRLSSIYTAKYYAIDKTDRDDQVEIKIETYVRGIMELFERHNEMKDDYQPMKIVKGDDHEICLLCESKDITPLTANEDENRYICNVCQAVHIPENGETKIFHHEQQQEINDSKDSDHIK